MTGDGIKLIEQLNNINSNNIDENDPLYKLYNRVQQFEKNQKINSNNSSHLDTILKLLNLIDDLEYSAYDMNFLINTGMKYNLKRREVSEILLALCDRVGKLFKDTIDEQGFIYEPIEKCPIKSKKVLYTSKPNRDYAEKELKYLSNSIYDYSHLKLGECRRFDNDWYYVYVFELLEDDRK